MDSDKLLVKLSLGKALNSDEIRDLVGVLEAVEPGESHCLQFADDIYGAILVIGKSGERSHHQLLAKHLQGTDSQTVSLILEILCLQWGMSEDYIEWVFRFVVGVAWDIDEDVRKTAIKILGEYLAERYNLSPKIKKGQVDKGGDTVQGSELEKGAAWRERNQGLLELLFSVFEDQDTDSFTRQAAYCSLLRVAGTDWEQCPSEFAQLNLDKGSQDVRWQTLAELWERRFLSGR